VALGGFSGRESEVSVQWLANAVSAGKVRWVLTSGSGAGTPGFGRDGRVGASKLMAAVAATGRKATTTTSGTLYDLQGRAGALQAYAQR
jgi:hypothetical protein